MSLHVQRSRFLGLRDSAFLWLEHAPEILAYGFSQFFHIVDGDVALTTLDLADVGSVQFGLVCQLFLGQGYLHPCGAKTLAKQGFSG